MAQHSHALITGTSRGIGMAIALELGKQCGLITGVSSGPAAPGLENELAGSGARYRHLQVDLGAPTAIDAVLSAIADGPAVDILVNNAGIIRRSPAAKMPKTDWDEVIGLDLTAPFELAQGVGTGMVERGHGRIIFIASLLSYQGGINVASYAAAKHGVVGVTKALSNEWARFGVTVNAVAPGYIATEATQALRDDRERSRQISERIPIGRWGQPADIAGAVAFLASDQAAYITGVTLPVDGGWLGR